MVRAGTFKVQADEEPDSEPLMMHCADVRAGFVALRVHDGPRCLEITAHPALHMYQRLAGCAGDRVIKAGA